MADWSAWPTPGTLDDALAARPADALANATALLALGSLASGGPFARERDRWSSPTLQGLERALRREGASSAPWPSAALAPALVWCRTLGRARDTERLGQALQAVEHREGGWLRHQAIGSLVLDTGLAVLALLEQGLPDEDPSLRAACAFLAEARERHAPLDGAAESMARMALRGAGREPATALPSEEPAHLTRASEIAGWLQALAEDARAEDSQVERALHRLLELQRGDGSWFDGEDSGVPFVTLLALDALLFADPNALGSPHVERAIHLLKRSQNVDGGWGFDEQGARAMRSSAEDTALSVLCLCRFTRPHARPMNAIEGGIRFLLRAQGEDGLWASPSWTLRPTVFALRAFAAFRETRERHLVSATKLVRNQRIAERKKRAAP